MQSKIKRHCFFYRLIRPLAYLVARIMINYKCSQAPDVQGPYVVLANHTMNWDPILVACSFKKPMNFVASEHAMRMGFLSKIISKLFTPIQRVKGSTDASAALGMVSMLKKGISVCLFPEGTRSFDGKTDVLHPTTGRLIKISGATLITYKLQGGYLTTPRWGNGIRRGRTYGEVVNIYTPEQLKSMTPQQVTDCINHDIAENAYERQKLNPYKYFVKGNAEGIERVLYICPKCHSIGSITSAGDTLKCSCGMCVRLDKYGFFQGEDVCFESIDKWNEWQIQYLYELMKADSFALSDEDQQLYILEKDHSVTQTGIGTLIMNKHCLIFGDREFQLDKLQMSIIRKQDIVFSYEGVNYEIRSEKTRSAFKYVSMMQILNGQKITERKTGERK